MPDVQNLRSNTNMRATFLAGGPDIERGEVDDVRSIDLAPTAAYLLGIPEPQNAQGVVRRDLLEDGRDVTPINVVGLNDFHGQLEPSAFAFDSIANVPVGGAAQLATMFDEETAKLPGQSLLLSGGDNVGASPPNSALLEDMPSIDVLNAWGAQTPRRSATTSSTTAPTASASSRRCRTSPGCPRTSSRRRPAAAGLRQALGGLPRQRRQRVGVIGATVKNTPELVAAGNTAGLSFLDEASAIKKESAAPAARWA